MSQPTSEHQFDSESFSGTVMAELFDAIGFEVTDEDAYNLMAEHVETSGERSHSHRRDITLHGRCWKIGHGLEVWSILYERDGDSYYADCRPAFRSRYLQMIQDWELIEYDEDGEAILCGTTTTGLDVVLELQNLTELQTGLFREARLRIALAGLAYAATANLCRMNLCRMNLCRMNLCRIAARKPSPPPFGSSWPSSCPNMWTKPARTTI